MRVENEIINDILKQYTSFENPDWRFVNRVVESNPYKDVIADLQSVFNMEEVTELNENVSFVYILEADGYQWKLFLSMVGRYCVLFRYNDIQEYLDADTLNDLNIKEQFLVNILKNAEIIFIPESLLDKKVEINFSVLVIDSPTIFECLFEQV